MNLIYAVRKCFCTFNFFGIFQELEYKALKVISIANKFYPSEGDPLHLQIEHWISHKKLMVLVHWPIYVIEAIEDRR